MFCTMYARFWCRLHTIDDTAGKDATLVSLCVLFLHLLEVLTLSYCFTEGLTIEQKCCPCQPLHPLLAFARGIAPVTLLH